MAHSPSLLARFKWALILGVLFLAWVPLQIVIVLAQVNRTPSHTLVTPGQAVFTLMESGTYTIWLQNQTLVDGRLATFDLFMPQGLTLNLRRIGDQAIIPLDTSDGFTTTLGTLKRQSIATAHIDEPGDYQLSATGSAEARLLYFARDYVLKTVLMVICTGCLSGALFLGMVIAAIMAIVKKSDPGTAPQTHPML